MVFLQLYHLSKCGGTTIMFLLTKGGVLSDIGKKKWLGCIKNKIISKSKIVEQKNRYKRKLKIFNSDLFFENFVKNAFDTLKSENCKSREKKIFKKLKFP